MQFHLYRNTRAEDNLDLFLVSAVSSLLLLRSYLYLAGYPQVGGGSLHIAHMLYGGLLMMAALVLLIAYLGSRVQRLAALVGGVGFGIFIDELGKFITKDNNYFFKPTIGIIYALFIVMYLTFNVLSRRAKLSSREYQLNALSQLEEVALHDLDATERRRINQLLAEADQTSHLTQQLQQLLKVIPTVRTPQPNRLERARRWLDRRYQTFWRQRASNRLIGGLFILEAGLFLVVVLFSIGQNIESVSRLWRGSATYGQELLLGQLVASIAAAFFVVKGAILLPSARLRAFEQFRTASLITLLLTEFFIFSRIQFGAMPGFGINLVILAAVSYATEQEKRLHRHQA